MKIVLVGNKSDLEEKLHFYNLRRVVSINEAL